MSTKQGEIPAPEGTEIEKRTLTSKSTGQDYHIQFFVDGDGDEKVKKRGHEKVTELFRLIQEAIDS